ncbi:MAG: hypothetical protein RLZZ387_2817 [Chloroflexota bacterium]|jgi:hypothetical protein
MSQIHVLEAPRAADQGAVLERSNEALDVLYDLEDE